MPTFDITRPKDAVTIDAAGKGVAPFTVTNLTGQSMKVRLEVVVDREADRGLLTIEGGTERNFRPNDSQNINVGIAAGSGAEPGTRKFSLKAVDVESPDDHFGESQTVTFAVPERKAEPKFPWWWLIAAAVALVLAGGGWYLYSYPKIGDYRGMSVAEAGRDLRGMGLTVKIVKNTIVLDAKTAETVVAQKIGTEPAEEGLRVKRGTEITVEVAVRMPRLKGLEVAAARKELQDLGIPKTMVEVKPMAKLDPASDWDKVIDQVPNPDKPDSASDHVVLTVAVKPEDVRVPPMLGIHPCAALKELERVGLNGRLQQVGNIGMSMVISPGPGALLPKGSTVTLIYQGQLALCYLRIEHLLRNSVSFGAFGSQQKEK